MQAVNACWPQPRWSAGVSLRWCRSFRGCRRQRLRLRRV